MNSARSSVFIPEAPEAVDFNFDDEIPQRVLIFSPIDALAHARWLHIFFLLFSCSFDFFYIDSYPAFRESDIPVNEYTRALWRRVRCDIHSANDPLYRMFTPGYCVRMREPNKCWGRNRAGRILADGTIGIQANFPIDREAPIRFEALAFDRSALYLFIE